MDFTQYNKINSCAPGNYKQRQAQYFVPQVQSFPNSTHSGQQLKYQNQNQSSSFLTTNMVQQQMQSGDSRSFVKNLTPAYKAYTTTMVPSNSYCGAQMIPGTKFLSQQPQEEEASDDDNVDIQYFHYTPTPSTSNKPPNQFKGVMDSLRQFSKSNQKIDKSCSKGNSSNNQTFCCQHEADDEHCIESEDQKFYKSHTRIQNIPNGVRIITEIMKEDNVGDSSAQTQTENWLNKKIEVSVDDCSDEN